MSLLIRSAEVGRRMVDVRLQHGRVESITAAGRGLGPRPGEQVLQARGGALLPGLHDRHLHLLAMAAAAGSVDLRGVRTSAALAATLGRAAGNGAGRAARDWLRVVGYHESIAGDLDRHRLDRLTGTRPTRVQHRSGALWVLNSAALQRIRLDNSADVERDRSGEPTGRLWRYDARLRDQLADDIPDLGATGAALAGYGITAVTDATPRLDARAVGALRALPQRLTLLGAGPPVPAGVRLGPAKILLHDHDLPDFEQLCARVRAVRAQQRAVAVHCVTRVALLLTLAVLEEVGRHPGDRIEHAAVVPQPQWLRGLTVVTQPGFVSTRGEDYRRDVDPQDLPHLYPFASLLAAGVGVHASSDAPFGPLDPWQVVRAARDRITGDGRVLGAAERVDAWTALRSYLGRPRLAPGMPADLCLLRVPLVQALRAPDHRLVRAVWIGGAPMAGAG